MKTKHILKGTRCYLIGNIEYGDAETWRNKVKRLFKPLGIRCYDPLKKPFVQDFDETPTFRDKMKGWRETGEYQLLSDTMRQIRISDLSLVDRSDFLICYLDLSIITAGTWEEIFWGNRLKRPIFLVVKQGKKQCPLWLFGTIPHKYIYDSIDDVISMVKKIDSGEKKIDSGRWKLLSQEWR